MREIIGRLILAAVVTLAPAAGYAGGYGGSHHGGHGYGHGGYGGGGYGHGHGYGQGGGYAIGFKVYEDPDGDPYDGYHYEWTACGWQYRPGGKAYKEEAKVEDRSIKYEYNITYNQPAALQGTSDWGLGAFTYSDQDNGVDLHRSEKYVAAGRSIDERQSDYESKRSAQNAYTRHKVADRLSKAQALAMMMKALDEDDDGFDKFLDEYSSSHSSSESTSESTSVRRTIDGAALASAEKKCMKCHSSTAASNDGGGFALPSLATANAKQREKIRERLLTSDDSRNMRLRAGLTDAEFAAADAATQ